MSCLRLGFTCERLPHKTSQFDCRQNDEIRTVNNKNLKRLSPSEARENGRKGGLASVKARRERKTMRELLLLALETENESGETNAESIVASMIRAARGGDVRAFVEIRDTIGEKPTNTVDMTTREDVPQGLAGFYELLAKEIKADGAEA